MQVAIYIRWSTEDQGEGTTLEVQREACRAYIRSQGWELRDDLTFIDEGFSGGTLERPGLTRLRAAVQAGQAECVVVYKLDRLSRSVVDMVRLVLDEWDGRCHVKSAREPIDTLSHTGRLFFYQLMSFAEWERSVIRERTFAGKLRRAQEGKNPGITAAYGYRLGPDGLPAVQANEARVVQLIFRLYLSGMGCTQIARHLAGLGHPSPAGRRWGSGQISRLLANPVYVGTLVYGKQTTSRGRKVRSERPHVVREGALPAIIDQATFAAVQQLKAQRPGVGRAQGSGRSLSSQSLLAGLLRCPCGHAYCGNGGAGARAKYRYYYCAGAQAGGPEACRAGRIRQDELDGLVAAALLEHVAQDQHLAHRVGAELNRALAEARAAAQAAERDLARALEKEGRLKAMLLDGKLTAEEYRELRGDLSKQVSALRGRLEAAVVRCRDAEAVQVRGDLSAVTEWESLALQERKRLVRQFISQVTAFRDRTAGSLELTIAWRFSPAPHPC
ncbi:MAG TPA: recombinase family protein [Symbiobacteriaceae bacterium]|nr:recombinase family protein [Symbiobacteriaceae bacterium]